jgi:predicted amidohydrolase YtcJ
LTLARDHHSHPSVYAALDGIPDLSSLDKPEAMRLLESLPKDGLSLVKGWYSARLDFTEGELLRLPPAVIANYSLHGVLLTGAARETLRDGHPELVRRHADPSWCERNLAALLSLYSRAAPLTAAKLAAFMAGLEALGVGSAEDMAVTGEQALSVIRASPHAGRIVCWSDPRVFRSMSPEAQAGVHGFKLFADGAIGLRTAALSEPYLGGGGLGLLLRSDSELASELAPLARPVAVHAIGERAVEQVLTALERLCLDGVRLPPVRIEHAQFITLPQALRAKSLGLTLSMQPNFSADSRDYAPRLSPRLREANNPFRMLIDRAGFKPGSDLVFGSDGMPHGMEAAKRWGLSPDYPGQALTLGELEAGYGL